MNKKELIKEILKSIEKVNEPTFIDYDLTKEDFGNLVDLMVDENLIKDATVIRGGIGNKVQIVFLNTAKITMKGINYLEQYENKYNSQSEQKYEEFTTQSLEEGGKKEVFVTYSWDSNLHQKKSYGVCKLFEKEWISYRYGYNIISK